jgi:hypothetical protein
MQTLIVKDNVIVVRSKGMYPVTYNTISRVRAVRIALIMQAKYACTIVWMN